MKSLKAQGNILADSHYQVELLETDNHNDYRLVPFQQKMESAGLYPLMPLAVEIFQVNVGKMYALNASSCRGINVGGAASRRDSGVSARLSWYVLRAALITELTELLDDVDNSLFEKIER